MEGALVDMKGVTMTDDQHIENFRRYKDSIGEFTADTAAYLEFRSKITEDIN